MAIGSAVQTNSTSKDLTLRGDLVHRRIQFGDRFYWVTKDPISSSYFYFSDREFTILKALDGRSPTEIVSLYATQYANDYLSADMLVSFLAQVRRDGLLRLPNTKSMPTPSGQRSRTGFGKSSLLSPMAIKLPGVSPDRMLQAIEPFTNRLFSPLAMLMFAVVVLLASIILTVRFDLFLMELTEAELWTTPNLALALVAIVSLTKIAHELAHAIVCRHMGGTCPEIGLMFLVFVPCLFCDVSDSWLQPDRWKRIAVSAAGMCVELLIAAIATLLWSLTVPGTLHTICLTTIVVCSVSTVVFNGNPLMRYDGYYILSDLVQIPNLASESRLRLGHWLKRIFIGVDGDSANQSTGRRDGILVAFAAISFIYRIIVISAILFAIHKFARSWNMTFVAWILTGLVLSSIVSQISKRLRTVGLTETEWRTLRHGRAGIGLTVGLGIILVALLYPFSRSISVTYHVDAEQQNDVFASVPGKLVFAANEGKLVSNGDTIFELENLELQMEVKELKLKEESLRRRLESLASMRNSASDSSQDIPALREAITAAVERRALRERELSRCKIQAKRTGIILAPPVRAASSAQTHDSREWTGTPLDRENLGCYVEQGTKLCSLGVSRKNTIALFVNQRQIDELRISQQVIVHYPGAPQNQVFGLIDAIDEKAVSDIPSELAVKNLIPAEASPNAGIQPLEPTYRVTVSLAEDTISIPVRTTGVALIQVAPKSLLSRFLRFFADSLRFEIR